MPPFLYHGTDTSNLNSIKRRGLLVSRAGLGSTARAFSAGARAITAADTGNIFMGSEEYARSYAEGMASGAMLRIDTSSLSLASLSDHGSEWRYQADVPPEAISYLADDRQYKPISQYADDELDLS